MNYIIFPGILVGILLIVSRYMSSPSISNQETYSPYTYCSYDNQQYQSERQIPSRKGTNMSNLDLKQVRIITRHGARTPDVPDSNTCFPKMRTKPVNWDCIYTEAFDGKVAAGEKVTKLFNQIFDANPQDNVLGGTCRLGQLMANAIPQLNTLGDVLFKTYFQESPLFSLEELSKSPEVMYLRSTDVQRTRHSMALLITRLFENMNNDTSFSIPDELEMHLMDHSQDFMRNSFTTACPEFSAIKYALVSSPEYKKFRANYSHTINELETLRGATLDTLYFTTALDCFMSYVCNDKQEYFPEHLKINPNSTNSEPGMVLYNMFEEENLMTAKWNNSVFARCIGKAFINEFYSSFNTSSPTQNPISSQAKFAYFSGHDSTFIYFLSSLDDLFDGHWPPYASMLTMEYYTDDIGSPYFRIVYNGKDITSGIKGCSESRAYTEEGVCPFEYFSEAVTRANAPLEGFATPPTPKAASYSSWWYVFYVVVGFCVGIFAMAMYTYSKKTDSKQQLSSVPLMSQE